MRMKAGEQSTSIRERRNGGGARATWQLAAFAESRGTTADAYRERFAPRPRRCLRARRRSRGEEATCVTGLRFSFSSLGGSALVVHHTQQISMAAVAGDADNTYINKQVRKMRTNRVNK